MTDLTDDQVKALLDRGAQLYNDAKHHLPLQARCADLARALLDARAELARVRADRDYFAAENASLKARGAGARNAAMLDCVRIVAEERNKQEPGPLFKVLNEAMGKIEDARFAPTKTESPGELVETLRAISMAQSLSVAQQTALKLIKDLGGQNG